MSESVSEMPEQITVGVICSKLDHIKKDNLVIDLTFLLRGDIYGKEAVEVSDRDEFISRYGWNEPSERFESDMLELPLEGAGSQIRGAKLIIMRHGWIRSPESIKIVFDNRRTVAAEKLEKALEPFLEQLTEDKIKHEKV